MSDSLCPNIPSGSCGYINIVQMRALTPVIIRNLKKISENVLPKIYGYFERFDFVKSIIQEKIVVKT